MAKYDRKTYYEDDDIRVYLEDINDQIFIHVVINNMSRKVFQKIKEKWGEVVIKIYCLGYNDLFTYTKDSRIVNLIGGAEKIGDHEDYEVYKWGLS